MIFNFFAGYVTGCIGINGAHHYRLYSDKVYRLAFVESEKDIKAIFGGTLVCVAVANGIFTSLLCWYFSLPGLQASFTTGAILFVLGQLF